MYQGHLMGPPTDPGPSRSARVSKWSVRPRFGIKMLRKRLSACSL
ncbi:unnamed protein product [Staurois parvus]|uniref:Uncharacterized protein n=1 Tax=Staurois parvus TaxID=386267 RepID=A0ABN9G8C9_9NEOB|nr:unnamed protein product [Staurois parvus]